MQTRTIRANLRGAAALAGITLNTLGWFAPILLIAVAKLLVPVRGFRHLMTRWLMAIAENWISLNGLIFGLDNSNLDVRGAEGLKRNAWYLVIANHQSWVDIIALQVAFNRRVPLLKFFIKQELIWFPVLGIAWWALDFPFMKRYRKSYLAKHPEKKGRDFEATRVACEKFRDTPTSVINFVEGTRFSEDKKKRCASPFKHLLPPRAGGIALALTSMGNLFDSILDVTLVYPTGVVHFWGLCCGELDRFVIDVRARPVQQWMVDGDYEHDREFRSRFHHWLTTVWQEKDGRIGEMSYE